MRLEIGEMGNKQHWDQQIYAPSVSVIRVSITFDDDCFIYIKNKQILPRLYRFNENVLGVRNKHTVEKKGT